MPTTETRQFNIATTDLFSEPEPQDFRYSPAFKGYQGMLESVLKRTGRAMSTRDIHIKLGVQANPRWTQDALEMSEKIIIFKGYPVDKFLWFDEERTIEKIQWNGCHVLRGRKNVTADLGLTPRVLA